MTIEFSLLFRKKVKDTKNTSVNTLISCNYSILLYLIILILFSQCYPRKIQSGYSIILLKIDEVGFSRILSENYNYLPNELIINDVNLTDFNKIFYFNCSRNIIKLIWYDEPSTTSFMFNGCINITEIDLSNFDTSSVKNMNSMFSDCSSLHSLDLSNFDMSSVGPNMFKGCSNLEYINLKSSKIENIEIISQILNSTSDNLIICRDNMEFGDLFVNNYKVNCMNSSYEDIDDSRCFTNKISENNKYSCDICGIDYHQKYNDEKNNNSYINCYRSLKGFCPFYFYYNNSTNLFYCTEDDNCVDDYSNLIIEKSQCIDNCERDTIYKYEFKNICYKEPKIDIISSSIYTINNQTTENRTELINKFNMTEINNGNDKKTFEKNSMSDIISSTIFTINNQTIENRTELIQNIIQELINKFNMTEINNGNDKKIFEKNSIIILTSTSNQKNNENENNITMDLGECENILKDDYNISPNDSLYILQIISEEIGMKIPKIEYEIYYPLNNTVGLTKLNLSSCKETKIEISIAVKINDVLDKYNSSSDYYSDICYKTTSASGTDISLLDRKNEFVNNNMSLCEENCDFIGYDYNKEKAKCSCSIKLNIPSNYDIKFNKKDFFKNFIDVKNIFNVNIMKCYKTVLKIKGLLNNYGFFFISFIVLLYIVTLIIFYFISYKKIKKEVKNIYMELKYEELPIKHMRKKRIKSKNRKKRKIKRKKRNNNINDDIINIDDNNSNNFKNSNNKHSSKKNNERKLDNSRQITENIGNNRDFSTKRINPIENRLNSIYNHKYLELKDFELNSLDYGEAIKLDHRNYFQYYSSLLKNNHPIMFYFGPYNDYNSKIIKIFLFFFSCSLDFAINALFFNDETMHKIYEDKGKFNILYQIPQIIYSTLISKFVDSLIKRFALSQNNIIEFKQQKDKKYLKQSYIKLLLILKIKFILFFSLIFPILMLIWYYITCFCGIYINTQIHLIKDSAISLLTSLFYPIVICLIPGIFRIASLNSEKANHELLYRFSSLLESYLC